MSAAATDAGSIRRGERRRLVTLTWAHLLNDGGSNYLPGILPAVLIAVHQPVRLAGALMAALIIGQALQPLTGWLADRTGGRAMVTAGLLLSSAGAALIGTAPSVGVLVALLLVVGIGGAMFHPQALAGVRSVVRGRHGLLTAVFLVGGELGRGIWPTIASVIVVGLGLGWLWLVGLPGLLTVPILFAMAPRLPARRQRGGRMRWRGRLRPLSLLIGYRSIQSFATYAMATFIPIMWHVRGGSLVGGAVTITVMITIGVVGNLTGGHLADRYGRRPILIIAAVAMAALIVPTALLTGGWLRVSAAVLGIALFLPMSTTILVGQDIFPENPSMGSGIALGLANGIGSVLVLVVGLLVSDTNVIMVFWLAAGLCLVAAVLAVPLRSHPAAADD